MTEFSPREIVSELDRFIVGQDDAKRAVAVALRNRWRRRRVPDDLRDEVTPKNILMIGPTGVGKTEIARRLARLAQAPFLKVEATKFTEVGYVGRDVDQIVRDLVESAIAMVREKRRAGVRARAEAAAEERILDALTGPGSTAARESFRKKLRAGELDDKDVQLTLADGGPAMPMLDIPGQPGRSDPNPPSFLNEDYSNWLLDVLDDLGIERAHFAGISAGAWIAMRFASLHPQRTRKVVMLGPTGISGARLPVKIWLGRVAQKWKNADVLQDDLTARSVSSKSPGGTFGTFDRQLARAMALCTRHYRVDRSLGIYNEATGKVNIWEGLRVLRKFFLPEKDAVLRQFAVPGLLVFGEHEVLYDPHAVGRKAQKLMGSIRVEVIAGAGHAAIYDRPEVVDPLVIEFLRA